ncbi:hypothetical protein POJ06DRAFT_65370 [Lipomyces tetrasporus]|uniref:Probable endonuclease LCL3 n=1 Tax=Lipomyces tetrasporus TaxID=54092 RepID=A0AAD7QXC7_9ASCO|nr:uncharacterized protein POJ06DRAFT_65370 [Lipomyces tetrasporus]KAJ8103204.1 hypothetical protein POJ06DRAFT_65370 [Lipomyces tetrasporus]
MWWPGRQEPEIDRPQPSPPRPRSAGQRIPFFSLETFLESCALTGTVLVCGGFYFRYLRRFQNALSIPQSFYTRGRTLSGRVVFVGDGDNFRLYHTPGGIFAGWDWLRRVPYEQYWRPNTSTVKHRLFETGTPPLRARSTDRQVQPQRLQQPRPRQRKLADETIHVRLCGIDAPECKSYGRPGQPFGPESRDWLRAYLLGRKVRIRLYSIDQYQRAVAKATVRSWTGPKDVSSEMLRAGLAVVYESKFQAAFGSSKEIYQREEQYARDHKNGMWKYGRTLSESPAEYKKRMRLGGDAPEASNDVKVNVQNPEPPTWQFARMIRSIFSKRKSPSLSPAEKQNKDG